MSEKGFEAHFDRIAQYFDKHYRKDVSRTRQLFDQLFHRAIIGRYRLTMQALGEVAGKTVLDVGCGSGRHALELARRGAKRVVGVDYASAMVELATSLACQRGLSRNCEFIRADFLGYQFSDKFDYALAMGVMDYTFTPEKFINKLKGIARELVLLSFPTKKSIIGLQRILRLAILNSSRIHLYSKEEIKDLMAHCGLEGYELTRVGRNYFVSVHLQESARNDRQRTHS